ncbi:MAG: hypothetical protein IKS33_03050 [Bacteroidales bacterium]|nr:hypothetical protein [Bacteroidales bacterium]MBO7346510.1 hypothetical protein [Bacteroidales bacterium]MBQ4478057.1 hypothetical protein [Bacteroidales bacterium]MBR4453220.1 hypothetical protein [Bacteroidales bacterium]MCR5555471.1 hypothetical protein [Bacteroidales bacterium]
MVWRHQRFCCQQFRRIATQCECIRHQVSVHGIANIRHHGMAI